MQVTGYSGAQYKSFANREAAQKYLGAVSRTRQSNPKGDPIYYKSALEKLLKEAHAGGLELSLGQKDDQIMLIFTSANGKCAGAILPVL